MKTPRATFPQLYARWKSASWPILTGRPEPAVEIPRPAQGAAHQQWEGEGGSCAKPDKAAAAPAPKIAH